MARVVDRKPSTDRPDRRPSLLLFVSTLAVGLLLGLVLGIVLQRGTAPDAASVEPVYDAEWNFIGATQAWPASPGADEENPFGHTDDVEVIKAGRIACTRAGDPGMSFDGMLDLFGMDPHQTYVILAEASDKLCPSQEDAITEIMD